MTTSRRPARGFSTWRTGLASISPIFAAQLNARCTAMIAPRLPRLPAGLGVDPLLDVERLRAGRP